MRIVVDRGRCVGMGICESVAPDRFEIGDDGVMLLHHEQVDTLDALVAVRSCPASSLSLVAGPQGAATSETEVEAGTAVAALTWEVKTSFVGYVRAVGGRVVADRGALDDGTAFVFPAEGVPAEETAWRFRGRVTFQAHDGLLDVAIADPWLRVDGADLEVSVVDGSGSRVTVARGRSDAPVSTPVPVVLVAGAEHLFDAAYPPGTPLAPVSVSLADPPGE